MDFKKLPGKFYRKEDNGDYSPLTTTQILQEKSIYYRAFEGNFLKKGDDDTSLQILAQIPNLIGIDFSLAKEITEVGVRELIHLRSLRYLNVSTAVDEKALESIFEIPYLENLCIFSANGEVLRALSRLQTLRHLTIGFIGDDVDTWEALGNLKQLESISLSVSEVDDNFLQYLAPLNDLKILCLKFFKGDIDLTKFSQLESAYFEFCDLKSTKWKENLDVCYYHSSLKEEYVKENKAFENFTIPAPSFSQGQLALLLALWRGIIFTIAAFLFALCMLFMNKVGWTLFIFAIFSWINSFSTALYFSFFIGILSAISGLIQNAWINAFVSVVYTFAVLYWIDKDFFQQELIISGTFGFIIALLSGGFGFWLCAED